MTGQSHYVIISHMEYQKAPESRKEREKKQRQEEIFSAASTLFAERGFEATTMEDISRKAEFAKGTLYNFFHSKEELFVSMVSNEFDKLMALMQTTIDSQTTPPEKLKQIISTQLAFFEKNKDFFKLLITETEKISANLKLDRMRIIKDKHTAYLNLIGDFFKQNKETGLYRDIAPHLLANILIGMIKSISLCFLNDSASAQGNRSATTSLSEKVDLINTLFLQGAESKKF